MKILLVVYDNKSYISWFPHNVAYLAAVLRKDGHIVEIYNQDVYHYSDEHFARHLKDNYYDIVGIGACGGYYQYKKIKKLCAKFRKSQTKAKLVLGGHLVAPDPDYFYDLYKPDIIVLGEGEETIKEIADSSKVYNEIDGIYAFGTRTKPRELIKDVDRIPFPAWNLLPMEHYVLYRMPGIEHHERLGMVLSGRGCPYKCNFCYRMDKGFRPRSTRSIIEEVSILKKDYNINYIFFCDELLMSSERRAVAIAEAMMPLKLKWCCNGRLNFATKEVLKTMAAAGCQFINYGIESLDDEMLERMGKNLTVSQIEEGVKNTREAKIRAGLNVLFGNIGETKKILRKGCQFLIENDDHAQMRTIRPVTPYPGSPLFDYAVEKKMIRNVKDFYEKKHKNSDLFTCNFTDGMTEVEMYEELGKVNNRLTNKYFDAQKEKTIRQIDKLYTNKNAAFRGFRRS